jgi:hypothetical protein
MAVQEALISVTLPAGADLRTHQFKFVSIDNAGKVVLTANNALAQGVLQNAPNTNEAATVAISGIVKVKVASGGITAGNAVGSAANGAVKNAATASSRLGIALVTAAENAVAEVLFHPIGA